MKKYILTIASILSFNAFSGDHTVKVCAVQSQANNQAFIQPCPDASGQAWTSKNNCGAGGWISWSLSTNGGQAMYSTALTAQVSKANVVVRIITDGTSCYGSYDLTSMMRIVK